MNQRPMSETPSSAYTPPQPAEAPPPKPRRSPLPLIVAAGVVLLIAFIGLCVWAWSSRRKSDFTEASRLPLEDDRTDREPRA